MWLTADEALARLGTKPQTLYANVSRGRIRARPDPQDSRKSLYNAEDVQRLAERHGGRRKSEVVAAETIRWGEPILQSAITTIEAGRLYYRGRDAVALSEHATLEQTAALLWEADAADLPAKPGNPPDKRPGGPLAAAFVALAARAAGDAPSYGRAPGALRLEAASVLATLAEALVGEPGGAALHERLAASWRRPQAADAIRRALVLLADHELNASTFAARVAVSTGASLAAGILAGLCALSGPLHGGASAGVQALAALADARGAEAAVRDWLGQGRPVPAFGHRLYPDGDARAAALLARLPVPPVYADLRIAATQLVGEEPNIDFALAAMAAGHGLPDDAPLTLFALARCVGWLAHGLEQAASGTLIRPRARYVGVPVAAAGTP